MAETPNPLSTLSQIEMVLMLSERSEDPAAIKEVLNLDDNLAEVLMGETGLKVLRSLKAQDQLQALANLLDESPEMSVPLLEFLSNLDLGKPPKKSRTPKKTAEKVPNKKLTDNQKADIYARVKAAEVDERQGIDKVKADIREEFGISVEQLAGVIAAARRKENGN